MPSSQWAKQEFYDWLRIVLPDDGMFPPGYQHYAYKDQDFYRGLCSESRIIRSSGKVEWIPDKSIRNEPLDLAVLCRAAAAICGIDSFSDDDWAELEGKMPDATARVPRNTSYLGERDDFWGTRGGAPDSAAYAACSCQIAPSSTTASTNSGKPSPTSAPLSRAPLARRFLL